MSMSIVIDAHSHICTFSCVSVVLCPLSYVHSHVGTDVRDVEDIVVLYTCVDMNALLLKYVRTYQEL